MASSAAINIASTIQSASIKRHPSPHHDVNPSTTASSKEPVTISSPPTSPSLSSRSPNRSQIPSFAIRPVPRHSNLPPLPDLRFEQSYLASLSGSTDWKTVGYITMRDQVVLPLVQGMLWTLVLSGWRYWNRTAQFSGRSVGSRIRRWWWNVNNWEIPEARKEKLASDMEEFYREPFATAGSD
ncbi:hypothetical protein MMC14_005855 [Varicellaria rhodocarpa]|nr:hypothetical protein [Varicellaria rhodocarpa]